jgi:hypothetical protein
MAASEADGQRKLDEDKEIKVKIPVDYHVKLHTLKVLRGQTISSSVETALRRFFEHHMDDDQGQAYNQITEQAIEAFHS